MDPFTDYTGTEERSDNGLNQGFQHIMTQSPLLNPSYLIHTVDRESLSYEQSENTMMENQVPPGVPSIKIGDHVFTIAANSMALTDEYREPVPSGNPLLIIMPNERVLRISRDFLVGEMAQAQSGKHRFNFARIDSALLDNLQKLRSFFGKPIGIIDGYYSPRYLKDVLKINNAGQIKLDPHITGRAVKMNIPGYNGMIKQVAVAAVAACDKDVSIGIGLSTMTLSVKQPVDASSEKPEDFQRITSYIPDEKINVAAYTFCVDFKRILYTHFDVYANSMQKAISAFAVFILKYHYKQNTIPAEWFDWEPHIRDTVSYMSGKSITNDPEVMIYCLAYTSFGNLYRYFLKEKSEIATVSSIINNLTVDSDRNDNRPDSFNKLQKAADKTRFIDNCRQRILMGKKNYQLVPATFFDWKNNAQDTSFHNTISNVVSMGQMPGQTVQQSPEGGTVHNLKLTPPNPDKPVIDFTGRYWVEMPNNHDLYGRWLMVNQAGNYISGKLAGVSKAIYVKLRNQITEFYGKLDDKGNAVCSLYPQKTLVINKMQNAIWLHIKENSTNKLIQNVPVVLKSKNPVISNLMMNSFQGIKQDLLLTVAWIPPLPDQLKEFFESLKTSEKGIKTAISKYYNDDEPQEGQRKFNAARYVSELHSANNNYLRLPPMYSQFAAYYTNYYYSVLPHWRPRDDKELMAVSGWIKRMLEDYRDLRGNSNIQEYKRLYDYFGIDTRMPDIKYQYQIKIELKGLSIGPAGRSSGTITIENKTDLKKYPKAVIWPPASFPIALWNVTASLNPLNWAPKFSIGQTIDAELTTGIGYVASDFSEANVQITEGKAFEIPVGGSSGGVKGSTKAGYSQVIILIDGHGKATLEFEEHGFSKPDTLEVEPSEPEGSPDPYGKIAGFLPSVTFYKGYIGKKDISVDIASIPVAGDFGTSYQIKNTRFFKHDDAVLSAEAIEAIGRSCADELVAFSHPDSSIEITGHADASGDPAYNLSLSKLRAANVMQAIKDRLGSKLKTSKIKVTGLGESEANTKYGQYTEKNAWLRRVVVFINGRAVLSLGEL